MSLGYSFQKVIVVGASSGIGEALVNELVAGGANVAIVARRSDLLDNMVERNPDLLYAFSHDVTEFDLTPSLFDSIIKRLGGLDLLVYAAGIMPSVKEGEYGFSKHLAMIEVNLLGAIAWIELAAARFEAAGRGTIVGISSIAGERGRRANPGYCTSKAALSTYLEALRNRCTRYGVNVVTIKPGFVDTAMTQGKKGLIWLVSAAYVARRCLKIARKGRSSSCYVPRRWAIVAWVLHHMPSWLFRRLSI